MADVTSIYGNPIKDAVARADIATNTQDISDLKDGLQDNPNFTAQMNISHIKSGTATVGGVSVTYSKDNISFSGTSTANGSYFISDSFVLTAGDYVLLDNVYHPEVTPNVHDWDVRILNANNQALANSVTQPNFTLASDTTVRVLLYIFGNKTLNVNTYVELYKNIGVLSNKNITNIIESSPNLTAGANEAVLKSGNWSGSGISAVFDTEKTVITGTASANASFFITDLFTLGAGNYYLFDGLVSHDGKVSLRVLNSSNTALAKADENFAFTLTESTSVKLLVYVFGGGGDITLYPTIVDQNSLSNEKLTEITRGLVGMTTTSLQESVKRQGFYPFACDAPTIEAQATFYNAVKNIWLYGAKEGQEYYFRNIFINSSALNPKGTYITVYDKAGSKVCEYNGVVIPNELQFLHLAEFNDSGISAVIEIDTTNIADNFAPSLTTYSQLGISDACIVHDDSNIEILCPDKIYAVVGMETNLYWDSLIRCRNIDDVVVEVIGNGLNIGNRWSYTPSSAGTISIQILVRDTQYRLLTTKTVSVVSVVKAVPTAKTINAIHIGDSMIDNEYHLAHLLSDMEDSNITYNILGSRTYSEGRGGWTSSQYISEASSGGVTNAFYNPNTQTFDFSYYMAQQGYSSLDVVFIFLGTNDIKGTSRFTGVELSCNNTIKNLNTIINSIHDYDANIKVVVNTAGIGANDQRPYAMMYGNNTIKQSLHKAGIQAQVSKILATYCDRENENIYVCLTGSALDNVHGFPTTQANASARISESITYQSDCYHPSSAGFYQFADCEFTLIRNKLV